MMLFIALMLADLFLWTLAWDRLEHPLPAWAIIIPFAWVLYLRNEDDGRY